MAILALGSVMHASTLQAPLALDDYAQRAMVEGTLVPQRGAFTLFDFVGDANRGRLIQRGALPWWTDPSLTVRFFRPFSSALTWIDCKLFGYDPLIPHVFSLCCWAIAVAAVALLFRSCLTRRAALVGTAIFALSPCHTIPLVWLANRNALLATLFGVLFLGRYLRWREGWRAVDGLQAGVLLGIAFFCGEYAAAFLGYVVVFECVKSPQPPASRLVGILPVFIAVLTSLVLSRVFVGDGTKSSGLYSNPFADFRHYAEGIWSRSTSLYSSAWLGSSDEQAASLDMRFWMGAMVAAIVVGVLWLWRAGSNGKAVVWLFLGSMAAAVPLTAVQPSWRVLGAVMVGVAGTVGALVDGLVSSVARKEDRWRRSLQVCVVIALVGVHLCRAPLEAKAISHDAIAAENAYDVRFRWVREHVQATDSMVLLLRAATPPSVLWTPFMLGPSRPVRWFAVSHTSQPITVIRTGLRSLDVQQDQGSLFPCGPGDLFNTQGIPAGSTVILPGSKVTVMANGTDGCPSHVILEFDRDLNDPSIIWIDEGRRGFQEIARPSVGIGVRLSS